MAAAMGASSGSAMTSTAAGATTGAADATGVNSKEIHTYQAPWMVYGLAASLKEGSDYSFRYAIGSFIEEYSNKVMVRPPSAARGQQCCEPSQLTCRAAGASPLRQPLRLPP